MEIINNIAEMQSVSNRLKLERKTISCVPTMGYLHEGHLSLIEKASESSDVVVTTLFVNPLQFAPTDDFSRYPRDVNRDFKLAESAGSNILFLPDSSEMYASGFQTTIVLSKVTKNFEGKYRPGHFDAVATVVAKLFNAVKPDVVVFGQKDFQQTVVVRQMIKDLNMDIDIIVMPTIREDTGLALSSRNIYLSEAEREKAGILYKALQQTERFILNGERNRKIINSFLLESINKFDVFKIDYAAAALAESLEEPEIFSNDKDIVLLVAGRIGKTRLIDNLIVNIKE